MTLVSHQKFEGKTEALKGFMFDTVGSKSADLFTQTLKQIDGYMGCTYQHAGDICRAEVTLVHPHLATPLPPPSGGIDPVAQAIFQEQVKECIKNLKSMWSLIWGKSSDSIRTRIEVLDTYEDMEDMSAGLELTEFQSKRNLSNPNPNG